MRLCIDVGNSSITLGFFDGTKLVRKSALPTAQYRKFRLEEKVDEVIYASVVPGVDSYFARYFSKTNFRQLTYKDIKNISIGLKKKSEIGLDRLVNVSGTEIFYGAPAVIIDLGTATTFCVLDKDKVYRGGLICPGLDLTRQVLHEKTAKLPLIELKNKPAKLIGPSTIEAMQSGIYNGYVALINGIIAKLKKEMPAAKIIATGGYINLLAQDIHIDIIDLNLTLNSMALFSSR